jgi:hypothetical protein
MKKILGAILFLLFLITFQEELFAKTYKCEFIKDSFESVKLIKLSEEGLVINDVLEIPLEKTRVKCGNFGIQSRFDGQSQGYQVILRTCSTEARVEGFIIDEIQGLSADIHCN